MEQFILLQLQLQNAIGTSAASASSNQVTPKKEFIFAEVTNPTTGKTWMDRNLGATQVATGSTDYKAYGDLYQWGTCRRWGIRLLIGHLQQLLMGAEQSSETSTLSSYDTPGHANFILAPGRPYNWLTTQNTNLWQGVNGVNNPCPSGYRLPTKAELEAECLSWSSNNTAGAFASLLKLPLAGYRSVRIGSLSNVGSEGNYWSSTVDGASSCNLYFSSCCANIYTYDRAIGYSVRCFKD